MKTDPPSTFIYALKDPETGKIRYIGKSNNPQKRFGGHYNEARLGKEKNHKCDWIISLAKRGLKPELEILDEVPFPEWKFWETEYIRVFKIIGMKLVNLTIGGEGSAGRKCSEEQKKKQSECLKKQYANGRPVPWKGQKLSQERRDAIRNRFKGKKLSPEHCAKISKGLEGNQYTLGRKIPPHEIEKRVRRGKDNVLFGKKRPPEVGLKVSLTKGGHLWTPEEEQTLIDVVSTAKCYKDIRKLFPDIKIWNLKTKMIKMGLKLKEKVIFDVPKEIIYDLHFTQGLSTQIIGDRYGVSCGTIMNVLIKHGLRTRGNKRKIKPRTDIKDVNPGDKSPNPLRVLTTANH